MGQKCYCCREQTGWFVWTTDRYFPRDKIIEKMNIKGKQPLNHLKYGGYPVCYKCLNELRKE